MSPGASPRVLVASSNTGKVTEIRRLLKPYEVVVLGLDDLADAPRLTEPYDTFSENACAKALQAAEQTGLLSLADDSGLMVDALDGRPGVYSSRYADTDAGRISRLLEEMSGIPPDQRSAHFVCVIALATPQRVLETWEGSVHGCIALEPAGTSGFGFDPVFYYPPEERTFAEMSRDEKNRISHRGRALHSALEDLPELIASNQTETG